MSKVKVHFQTFVEEPGMKFDLVGITKIEIVSSTTDTLALPGGLIAATVFPDARAGSVPSYYIGGRGNTNDLSIDGGTVGNTFMVVSRHKQPINADRY